MRKVRYIAGVALLLTLVGTLVALNVVKHIVRRD